MLNIIIDFLFGRFRSYEKEVLAALSARLSEPARNVLNAQLDRVNKIQRHANDKEVNLYCMRRGKVYLEKALLFPNESPELLLAIASIKASSLRKPLRVEIWMSLGRVFSIIFDRPPKWLDDQVEVMNLNILADPMVPYEGGKASVEDRNKLIASIDAKLPDEYLALCAGDHEVEINGWHIYDLGEVRKVVQPDRNYYILAEKDGVGAIAVEEEDQLGQMYYVDYDSDVPVKLRTSLRQFFENKK